LIIQPDWIIEARDEWKNDEKVWTLIQRLQQDSSASDTFTWKNDSLSARWMVSVLMDKHSLEEKWSRTFILLGRMSRLE
jgi:hypothetical protein